MLTDIYGVILAGGESRRMGGGDKGLEMVGRQPLLAHALARLSPQVPAFALNANGPRARFSAWGLEVIPDAAPDRPGPLAGVLAGLDWAAERGARGIVTVAWDTPFFPRDLVPRLIDAAEAAGTPLAMAVTPDPRLGTARHPTFGLWDAGLREDLRACLAGGMRRVVEWTARHGCAEAMFEAEPFDPFFNVNAPEDLAEAERLWAAHLAPGPTAEEAGR
ncbi:molybdenum cofactor guanylyltransferase [Albimonas donghaensis]|uniref:Molybdenum cofactor guanylyltransferase n=1 Tax=Albimonas donghaensis TaxID=356660 RepID=A0A1H2Z6V1_9RHOB|nr:molybdenum cofactor guanylyltransferase MobA [Albimonas donghaensis]SDX13066.1 molybdenum cofactor guanylyltransferase [Albimonas donghaensis]